MKRIQADRRTVFQGALSVCGLATLGACGSKEVTTQVENTFAIATSEVPVGGGVIIKDARVVITQPKAGEFKAFSAVCPHAGLAVGEVSAGQIKCLNHGSEFAISDGSLTTGPATSGLTEISISVKNNQIIGG